MEAYSKEFGSGKSFSGSEVSFKELVELLHKPGEKVEGSGNALSYAVKKAGAKLEPMRIPRRSLRDDDVHFAITHCGEPALSDVAGAPSLGSVQSRLMMSAPCHLTALTFCGEPGLARWQC